MTKLTDYQCGYNLGYREGISHRQAIIGTRWSEKFVHGYWNGWGAAREEIAKNDPAIAY